MQQAFGIHFGNSSIALSFTLIVSLNNLLHLNWSFFLPAITHIIIWHCFAQSEKQLEMINLRNSNRISFEEGMRILSLQVVSVTIADTNCLTYILGHLLFLLWPCFNFTWLVFSSCTFLEIQYSELALYVNIFFYHNNVFLGGLCRSVFCGWLLVKLFWLVNNGVSMLIRLCMSMAEFVPSRGKQKRL